ncbi:MAG: hypothetical protein ACLU38_16105 [Dysosmobacter sp.]
MLAAGNLLVLAVTALAALLGGLALTPALLTWFVVATLLDLDLPGPGDPVRHGHRVAAGGAGAVRRRQLPGGGADLAGPATGGASAGRLSPCRTPSPSLPGG